MNGRFDVAALADTTTIKSRLDRHSLFIALLRSWKFLDPSEIGLWCCRLRRTVYRNESHSHSMPASAIRVWSNQARSRAEESRPSFRFQCRRCVNLRSCKGNPDADTQRLAR